jgi:hypothetical protein
MHGAKELEGIMSDTDRVFKYLETSGASFVSLYHSAQDIVSTSDIKKSTEWRLWTDCRNDSAEECSPFLGDVNDVDPDLSEYALQCHDAVKASNHQDILIAYAWATREGNQFFQAFPE